MARAPGSLHGLGARLRGLNCFYIERCTVRGGTAAVGFDVWGVIVFWIGAVALFAVVFRRGRGRIARWQSYVLLFTGIAGMIAGRALIFLPDFG